MKEYLLNYYPQFECVGGECKHTCCAGWEMCIDEHTLNVYKGENSAFSKRLQKGVNFKKSKFKTDKNGRCAFLNDKGLCEIIINLGKDKLCQVCSDHPRFRSFFENAVEMGLGFSCEQATKIILSFENKIEPVLVKDDKLQKETSFVERQVLNFREKALNVVQDRNEDINQRINELLSLCFATVDQSDFEDTIKTFSSLEILDPKWLARISKLTEKNFALKTSQELSLYAEQFLVNSIYRHLADAEDTLWVRARTIAIVLSWFLINSIFEMEKTGQNAFACVCDIVRAFSADVEYSQKNLNKLFDFAFEFVNL